MATHSSTLAWAIPQTEEPGGEQSIGSQEQDITERSGIHAESPEEEQPPCSHKMKSNRRKVKINHDKDGSDITEPLKNGRVTEPWVSCMGDIVDPHLFR